MLTAAAATTALLAASTSVTAADPDGGARWTARLTDAGARGECATVRRDAATKGRFCARLTPKAPFQYSVIRETAPDPQRWRTAFVVVLDRAVRRATLVTADGSLTYRRGRPRVLLAVLRGRVEQGELRVRVRIGRRTYTATAGRPRTAEAADPLGETGWRTIADPPSSGVRRRCVAWERAPLRFGGTPPEQTSGRDHCGLARSMRPVTAVEHVDGRLVVLGLVGSSVDRVELRDGPSALPLAFDRRSRSYLAVLPDRDPASLSLETCSGDACTTASVED